MTISSKSVSVPSRVQVVVIGGGIIGCSIAYHLTCLGCTDVVVLERRSLGCGTTWHSQGLIGLMRATPAMTRLAMCTNEVLRELEAVTGLSTGFKQSGSLIYTTDATYSHQLDRLSSNQRRLGLDINPISVGEARNRWPLLNTDDVVAAYFMPLEGQTNPLDSLQAYAKAARLGGASIIENATVTAVSRNANKVTGVHVGDQHIDAEIVVNAAGIWSRELALQSGVDLPVQAVEQSYFVTEAIPGLKSGLPILRDYQDGILVREDAGQLTVGATSPLEQVWGAEGIPEDFSFEELAQNREALEPMVAKIIHRIPVLESVGVRKFLTGPECISPDARYYLGESPQLKHYFVASGMSGVGVGSSGGVGRELAAWIVNGYPSMDLQELDIARVLPYENTKSYLLDRVPEGAGSLFSVFSPHYQPSTARGVRQSALQHLHTKYDAVFEPCAGWERPAWYMHSVDDKSAEQHIAVEHQIFYAGTGVLDLSCHTKILVQGRGCIDWLQRLCTSDLPNKTGCLLNTLFCNERGGIEALASVAQLSDDSVLILVAPELQSRFRYWLCNQLDSENGICVIDQTSAFVVVGLIGKHPLACLEQLGMYLGAASEWHLEGHVSWCRQIDVAYCRGWLMHYADDISLEHYELVVPAENASDLLTKLLDDAGSMKLHLIGSQARRSYYLEARKIDRERLYSTTHFTVLDSLLALIDLEKSQAFTGLLALREFLQSDNANQHFHYMHLALDSEGPALFGNEPVWLDGAEAGYVVESAFGYRQGVPIGLVCVHCSYKNIKMDWSSNVFEIEIAGVRYPARIMTNN